MWPYEVVHNTVVAVFLMYSITVLKRLNKRVLHDAYYYTLFKRLCHIVETCTLILSVSMCVQSYYALLTPLCFSLPNPTLYGFMSDIIQFLKGRNTCFRTR